VAAVFNRHAKTKKGLAVTSRRHDSITVAMGYLDML